MSEILDLLLDTIIDGIKILPFLFITYLLMEYIEHKTSKKTKNAIKKSGYYGPLIGGLIGAFPQCGFSVSATNLYAGRVITLGTLISVYLSTSDEMLPILISEGADPKLIIKILLIKIAIGILAGVVIDIFLRLFSKSKKEEDISIENICEHEHCHCEDGIFKSALKHTINIFIFIFLISLILNLFIYLIGEEALANLISNKLILGPVIVGLIGLIPNCASSVIITQLYIEGILNLGTMIGGLLVNAGLGVIVLFKVNKNIKENLKIVSILYSIGVISGIIFQLIGI